MITISSWVFIPTNLIIQGNDGRVKEGGQDGISCRVGNSFSGYCLHSW